MRIVLWTDSEKIRAAKNTLRFLDFLIDFGQPLIPVITREKIEKNQWGAMKPKVQLVIVRKISTKRQPF